MFITGLGTAALPQQYEQKEGWDTLQQSRPFQEFSPRSRGILRKALHGDNGLAACRFALVKLTAQGAGRVLEDVLARAKTRQSEIEAWVLHPGGRDVLLAVRERLGLSEQDLRWSAAVLREFGNASSASVIFVAQAALADSAPGGYRWMSSFGAGFGCDRALLKVGE